MMGFNLLDGVMVLWFFFILWTIFFGAMVMNMFQSNAMFIGAIFIGLVLLEVKFTSIIINKLEVIYNGI